METKTAKNTEKNIEKKITQFDANSNNEIFLAINKGDRTIQVSHTYQSVSDESFFKYSLEQETFEKKINKKLDISNITFPQDIFWDENVIERKGYKEASNWKEKTPELHKRPSVGSFFECEVTEKFSDSELYDEDETLHFELVCRQNGELITTHHYLQNQLSKKDFVRLAAVVNNLPDPNNLASAKKQSQAEKLAEFYPLIVETIGGYKDDIVPAWHKVEIVGQFFISRVTELGKLT